MRIVNESGSTIEDPDLDLGHLVQETIVVAHHPAVEAVEEQGHRETIAEYESGGKDTTWIVDVPAVKGIDAWDETEDVLRYVPYTAEELAEIAAQRAAEDAAREESEKAAAEAERLRLKREAIVDGASARFEELENSQLDQDEAITSIFEMQTQALLDQDEAITGLYEMMAASATTTEGASNE